jgi:hypothetical protein
VIAKVEKELQNPKVLQQILDQSVKDVESKSDLTYLKPRFSHIHRTRVAKGIDDLHVGSRKGGLCN